MNGQNKWLIVIFSAVGRVLGAVVAISFFAGIIWLAHFLFTSGQELLLGLLVGLVPTLITVWQYKQQTKLEHKQWLLRDSNACLLETIDIFVSLLQQGQKKTNSKRQERKLLERFKNLRLALFAHASASTLKAWDTLMVEMVKGSLAPTLIREDQIIREGERFFRTIRRDLGHNDSDLQPGELWGALFDEEGKQKALAACKGEDYSDLYKKDK